MRKNQSSLTAAGIAIARAVESEKPVDEPISPVRTPLGRWQVAMALWLGGDDTCAALFAPI